MFINSAASTYKMCIDLLNTIVLVLLIIDGVGFTHCFLFLNERNVVWMWDAYMTIAIQFYIVTFCKKEIIIII